MFSCFPPWEEGNRLVMKLDIVDEGWLALGMPRPLQINYAEATQTCRKALNRNQSSQTGVLSSDGRVRECCG